MSAPTRQAAHSPCRPEREATPHCHAAGGASLVIQYVDERARENGPDPVEQLQRRVEELERKLSTLASYNGQLEEALRQMQIGFRRHRSERVDPNQLTMTLSAADEHPDGSTEGRSTDANHADRTPQCDPGSEPTSGPAAHDTPCAPGGDGDAPAASPKRHRHGRRKVGVVPQVVVQVLPPEVLVEGLEAYEQIGHEDTSIIGYRRGGPIELVFRRGKYVRLSARSSEQAADAASGPMSDAAAQGRSAGNGCCRPATTSDSCSETSAPPAQPLRIVEHEMLSVPQDPTCRHNPFVDGAVVRYFPQTPAAHSPSPTVLIAPPPERPLAKGMADASLLAHLFVDKQGRHLPYYRQEAELERFGWPISRSTMARWQFECGQLVRPLVDQMWQQALERSWFAMDATGTAIRGSPQYERGHVFVLVAEGQSILFRFSPTHDGETIERLFGGHSATILADASSCHNGLFGPGKNTEAGCWAHARRRFVAAFRAAEGKEPAAVLQTMQTLFRIEREIACLEPQQRLDVRQRVSAPLVDDLLRIAKTRRNELPSDSLTRKGFVYLDNQSGPLREFLSNGELPIHNNVSERELRRHVKGRINWLFHGSADHAHSACALSSLVASAELHGLDPEFYLQEILTVLPSYPVNRVLELAPESWLETRKRLIDEGRLKYLDIARVTGSALSFRTR